jgi:hypothetical protein
VPESYNQPEGKKNQRQNPEIQMKYDLEDGNGNDHQRTEPEKMIYFHRTPFL